ncbi:MAG: glycosyltransferase family 9 protein [bacterium]|nr:glycosyltransferase family 9 protein [bacterium]
MSSILNSIPQQSKNSEGEKVKNILVVRQHNHIGDMLCSLTLYAALKKKYPDSKITLVAAKTSYEIPLFELNPFLDRVIIFDKQNFTSILKFFRKLRERKYQLGIVPSTIKVSRTSHIINSISGAKIRVGVKSVDGIENKSHKFLNVKSDFVWKNLHQLERNLDIVRQIGCDLTEEERRTIRFNFSAEEISDAKNLFENIFPDKNRKIVGIHPGAGKKENMWPTKNFVELIKKLHSQFNCNILLTAGKVDAEQIKEIENELRGVKLNCHTLIDLPIKKLGATLSLIDLYITNDTGSMHIAGFAHAKIISLFGPTNPAEWAPRGENKYYIKSKTENINDITIDEVYNLSKKILEEEK